MALRDRPLGVHRASPAQRLAQGFGYLSEDRTREGLALPLSIADNLTATRLSACGRRGGWLDLGRQSAATRAWIGTLGLRAASPWETVGTHSGSHLINVA